MKKILFITNMSRHFHAVRKWQEKNIRELGAEVELYSVDMGTAWDAHWPQRLLTADAIYLTYMGSGLDTPFLRTFARFSQEHHLRYLMLIDDIVTPEMVGGFTAEEVLTAKKYIAYSGPENYAQLFHWTAGHLLDLPVSYQDPKLLPWQGIWNPQDGKIYEDFDAYREAESAWYAPERKNVGILFYREEWLAGDLLYQRALAQQLWQYGLNPLPFFAPYGGSDQLDIPNLKQGMERLFGQAGKDFALHLLIHTGKFSLVGLQAVTIEDLLGFRIPILQAYNMSSKPEDWQGDIQGLNAMDVNLAVSLPEMDGVLHGGVLAGYEVNEYEEGYYRPIEERVDALARKAKKWVELQEKNNADKKIAIIFHNYPADNANIGSAAGLDSIESVRRILQRLQEEGYGVDTIPEDGQSFIRDITRHATNDRRYVDESFFRTATGRMPQEEYIQWWQTKGPKVRERMQEDWGEPPGEVFVYDDHVIVPGYLNGNIFITLQPPRGFGEDAAKIYHSPDASPTHHYEAFYHWLGTDFQADAVLHIGTHGTLEWLPGKGAGLSADCYPEMALDDLPNIYPYWTTIVGEGIQAKRRSAACLIGHLTPPQDRSGLYEEMEEMQNLLDEYFHFKTEKPDSLAALQETVLAKAEEAHLLEEISGAREMSFDDLAAALHVYLTDIENMQMRSALHILGDSPKEERKVKYLSVLTRIQNGDWGSLPETIAEAKGLDWDLLQSESHRLAEDGRLYSEHLAMIWRESEELLAYLAEHHYIYNDDWQKKDFVAAYAKEYLPRLSCLLNWISTDLAGRLDQTQAEMENLVQALEGKYIEPGPGGAPTSGRVDILPTGRNFYGIDSRKLPTPAAWAIGVQLAEDVIAQFIDDERRYPEMVGIVLWAGANTRSHGQCVAQFMALLGVRPVWQKGSGRVIDLEVIPLAELGRPRIDVTGRISGLFRDMMPTPSIWLDKAMKLVAALDEPPELNYVRKHIDDDVEWLMREEGIDRERAFEQARWRIFGDAPGAYGAGVCDLLENGNWETIDDLADVYVRWGGHAYTSTEKGTFAPSLFRRRLQQMEVTVQNQDNSEFSMLSSDDYNSYHGGMIAAVRSTSGKAPKSYSGDSTDRSRVKVRTLREQMHRLFRGEAANPKFIQGMKEHGYKGASDLAKYVAHAYQWDVTSSVLEQWMYDAFADKYALDAAMKEWMQEVNPWALQSIAKTLLEAHQRGYWQGDEERLAQLQDIYLAMEGELEEQGECK